MSNYVVSDGNLIDIADAIREKGQTVAPLEFPDGFTSAIRAIPTGGGGDEEKDVVFWDQLLNEGQGGVAYTYTVDEFLALNELPANPDHSSDFVCYGMRIPMTSQGWSWTLAQAQNYVQKYRRLVIGQKYIPTDGATHIIVATPKGSERITFTLPINGYDSDMSVSVDGGPQETIYAQDLLIDPGIHDISIFNSSLSYTKIVGDSVANTMTNGISFIVGIFVGNGFNQASFKGFVNLEGFTLGDNIATLGDTSVRAFDYCIKLKRIVIAAPITSFIGSIFESTASTEEIVFPRTLRSIPEYVQPAALRRVIFSDQSFGFSSTFSGDKLLEEIIMPDSISSNSMYFQNCISLKKVRLSENSDKITNYMFNGCWSLRDVVIPDGYSSIGFQAFTSCFSLEQLEVPQNITSIGAQAFAGSGLKTIRMASSIPPSLSNVNAFAGLWDGYQIIVPAGSKATYDAETNWSTLASHIVEEAE